MSRARIRTGSPRRRSPYTHHDGGSGIQGIKIGEEFAGITMDMNADSRQGQRAHGCAHSEQAQTGGDRRKMNTHRSIIGGGSSSAGTPAGGVLGAVVLWVTWWSGSLPPSGELELRSCLTQKQGQSVCSEQWRPEWCLQRGADDECPKDTRALIAVQTSSIVQCRTSVVHVVCAQW